MLDSLRKVGKEIGKELNRAWENLSDGWRELLSRSGNALTHFSKSKEEEEKGAGALASFPSWSLLAGEVMETEHSIIVRLEVPGMERKTATLPLREIPFILPAKSVSNARQKREVITSWNAHMAVSSAPFHCLETWIATKLKRPTKMVY